MTLSIEQITPVDLPTVLALMREFAAFEKLDEFLEVTSERLSDAMFGDFGFVEGLIARDTGTAVAYALFYPHFASFRGQRGLYIEDIYVSSKYRGSGVGHAMLKQMARIAASRGFERIDFLVLDWNTPATGFYERLGAARDEDERHYKFTDDAFRLLAED